MGCICFGRRGSIVKDVLGHEEDYNMVEQWGWVCSARSRIVMAAKSKSAIWLAFSERTAS